MKDLEVRLAGVIDLFSPLVIAGLSFLTARFENYVRAINNMLLQKFYTQGPA